MVTFLQWCFLAVIAAGSFVSFGVGIGLIVAGALGLVGAIAVELNAKKSA